MANTYKSNPRIKAATNGIILEWDEYSTVTKSTYGDRAWIGNNSKVFTRTQGQEAIDELLLIESEGYEESKKRASQPNELSDSPIN